MPHSFICPCAPTSTRPAQTHGHHPLVCSAVCSFARAFRLIAIFSPTFCSQPRPLVLLLYLVPPKLCHHSTLSCSLSLTPSFSHPLFPVAHSFSSSLAAQPSHSLPFINPPDDTGAHLAFLLILHNSLWLGLLSPSLYRSPPPIPIKDLRAPLSANQVVIRAAKIRGLINKGLSLLASGSLCLNR